MNDHTETPLCGARNEEANVTCAKAWHGPDVQHMGFKPGGYEVIWVSTTVAPPAAKS